MTTVTFTTVPQSFPSGTVAGSYRVDIVDPHGNITDTTSVSGTTPVQFSSIPPGTYMAHVTLLSQSGSSLGSTAVSDPFTILDTASVEISLEVPSTVTVTV